MTKHPIPPDALEAAELAAHDAAVMWKWSEMNRDESREFFTAVLEAAAPHILAQAWDEAYRAGRHDGDNYDTPNPYRRQP